MTQGRLGISLAFFVNGAGLGLWIPHIPLIRRQLALDDPKLGLALLAMGLGAVLIMPLVSFLISRFGSKPLVAVAGVWFCAGMCLPAHAHGLWGLCAALFAWGIGNGALDVAMNVQASRLERESRQHMMSSFHGLWSLGALVGSGVASAALLRSENAALTMMLGAAALLPVVIVAAFFLLPGKEPTRKRKLVLANRALLILCALSILGMVCEGALSDWSGVYLTQDVGMPLAIAGFVFTGTAALGTLIRLALGDYVTQRFGSTRVLLVSAALAAGGTAVAVAVPHPIVSPLGFAVAFCGISSFVPLIFSAAGKVKDVPPEVALGTVATLGYVAFLAGPPLIGALSSAFSLRAALMLLPVLCAGVGVTAWLRKL